MIAIEEVEGKEIDVSQWETGFLRRSSERRTFERLSSEELRAAREH
jgi:hypothetical protein